MEAGWVQGVACPCTHSQCHGVDVHSLGDEDGLNKLRDVLEKRYEKKVRATLGFKPKDDRFTTFLNREVSMTEDALELGTDPRHATEIIRSMDLDNGKSDSTSIVRELESTETHDRALLDRNRASILRSVCMRAAYLIIDRYDLHYTAKESAREIHAPTERG